MPIEIRELIIRAIVEPSGQSMPGEGQNEPASEAFTTEGFEHLQKMIKERNER